MAERVLARILIKNNLQLLAGTVREYFNCKSLQAIAEYWLVPVVKNGILLYYKAVISATKPTIDSVKSVRLRDKDSNTLIYVGIADNATIADVVAKCNECCDSATALADITVPKVYAEEILCGNDTDGYNQVQTVPALGAGQHYNVYGSLNGVAFTADLYGNNYASVAAAVAAMTTSWAAYGTFTASGQTVTWHSATGGQGSLIFRIN